MKRYLFIILLLSPAAWGASAFTAVASGDWQSNVTWGTTAGLGCHVTYPCMTDTLDAGDTATIDDAFTVTCGTSETCSIGNSPAANSTIILVNTHSTGVGGLTIGTNATFIYAGSVSIFTGTFTANPGATIQYDSSWSSAPTTVAYYWMTNSVGHTAAHWSFNGTIGNHITWQGDSFADANADPGICAQYACMAGSINYTGGSVQADIGYGTLTYVDIDNIQGINDFAWYNSEFSNSTALGDIVWTNVTVNHSNGVKFVIDSAGAINNITITSLTMNACLNAGNPPGCLAFGPAAAGDTGAGVYTITGLLSDGPINTTLLTAGYNWTIRNALLWTDGTIGNPNQYPGFTNTNDLLVDQVFTYGNGWNAGSSQTLSEVSYVGVNSKNSVYWTDRVVHANDHATFLRSASNSAGTLGVNSSTNNIFGTMGNRSATALSAHNYGGAPSTATTITWNGNIETCGYNGLGSTDMPGAYLNQGATSNLSIIESGNTYCATTNTGGLQPTLGASGFETVTIASGTIASIDSNLLFCTQSGGCDISLIQGFNQAGISPTAVTFAGSNAIANVNTYTQEYPPLNYVVTLGTDTQIHSRLPNLIEPGRVVPLFDTEYLIPTGLLPLTTYTSDPGWKAAWTVSTSYSVGDIVSFSDPTAFGGRTTYWRCIQAHTSASTNEPVLAFDASNPYREALGYWELAFLAWMRPKVLANTTYDFHCGGLLFVACPTPHTYIVGLLAAWVRQGYTSMETALWNGCLSGKECGAIELMPIQHLPPPVLAF